MSLILEALRKSEAERRRGQAPQLFDAPAPVAAPLPARARVTWWWVVPVLVAVLLALLWWRSASRDDALLPESVVAEDAASERANARFEPTLPTAVVNGSDASTTSQPPTLAVDTPAVPVVAPVVMDAPPSPAVVTPAQPGSANVARVPLPSSATPPAPNASSPDPASTPTVSAAPATVVATPPRSAPPATPPNAMMRLADLTASERTALPTLRMSMHMWAPEPGGRFVILDGTRVGEGDLVGGAVVDEITPDGAVLNWQGRRLKVPVR